MPKDKKDFLAGIFEKVKQAENNKKDVKPKKKVIIKKPIIDDENDDKENSKEIKQVEQEHNQVPIESLIKYLVQKEQAENKPKPKRKITPEHREKLIKQLEKGRITSMEKRKKKDIKLEEVKTEEPKYLELERDNKQDVKESKETESPKQVQQQAPTVQPTAQPAQQQSPPIQPSAQPAQQQLPPIQPSAPLQPARFTYIKKNTSLFNAF